ncbi:MAG: thioredoxin [Syntrophales bacterium]
MNNEEMVVRCLKCGAKNRISKERMHDRPLCGKCGKPLDEIIIRCLGCGTKNRIPENRLNENPLCGKCGVVLAVTGDQGRPLAVNDLTFDRAVLAAPGAVLVDCWAPWCAPCRLVAPILDELAAKYAGGIMIAKLNVDENQVIASRYNIRSIPTMLFFRDGKIVNTLIGALPKETIEQNIIALIKKN